MLLQEMFNRCLVNCGMMTLSPEAIELRGDAFEIVVRQCLEMYNKYCPFDKKIYKNISQNRQYEFTADNTADGIPDRVVDMIPLRIAGVYPFFLFNSFNQSNNVEVKDQLPYEYRKPFLTICVQGEYDIHVVYNHKLTRNSENLWECTTISDSDVGFFKYLSARFMEVIGRNRRAFTMHDLPIETDAENMVNDAKELAKEALEDLQNIHMKFYLAWGG